jgi:hypothetical protein
MCSESALDNLGDFDVYREDVLHEEVDDGLLVLLEVLLNHVHFPLLLVAVCCAFFLNSSLELYKND